jgi:cysteine synthase A
LKGRIDAFVAGIGTGGTITGVGEVLKEKVGEEVKIYGVEPLDSPVLSGGNAGSHKIQGIGAGFIPDVLNTEIYDEIISVKYEDAVDTSRKLAKLEGIFVGVSAGAATWAGVYKVSKSFKKGDNIVILLPDTGERYLSTDLF